MKRIIFILFALVFGAQFFIVSCSSIIVEVQDAVYVSPNGNDSNKGLKDSPVKSLNRALEIVKEKSINTIYIEEGIWLYFSSTTFTLPSGLKIKGGYDSSFSQQNSFSMFSNVSFDIVGVNNVELDSLIVKNVKPKGVRIENARDILIQYCIFWGITNNILVEDVEGVAVRILNSSGVRIQNSLIGKCYGLGKKVFGAGVFVYRSSDVKVDNVTIHDCFVESYDGRGGGGAIAINGSTNVSVINSILSNCDGIGADEWCLVYLYGSSSESLVFKDNIIGYVKYGGYGISERVSTINHTIVGNKFLTNNPWSYVYYDTVKEKLTINQLNNGDAGTLNAYDNVLGY